MNTPTPTKDHAPDNMLKKGEPAPTVDMDPASSQASVAPSTGTASTMSHAAPPGYELLETIGEGGMGVVYRARDLGMDREVAVKVLHGKYAPRSAAAQRFVDEAKITGQLQHPGIPPMYHVGMLADGRPFLAMKLIKGQTLDCLLKARQEVAYLPIFEAICHAVGYAHAHNVIHRDLKPANIMVGAFGEVQVMDWGLAKVLTNGATSNPATASLAETIAPTEIRPGRESETQAGSVLGTPTYMAPEQAAGEIDKIDQRTDVFGLGAILCTMLTGHPPFTGKDVEAIRVAALRGQTADAMKRLDACGAEPEVVFLCKRCLSFEPADRPAHGNALAQAVAALRTAAEERAKQAEFEKAKAEVREAEQRQRRRVVLMASLVVVTVLLAGVIGTTWGLFQAEEQRQEANEQKEKAIAARKDAETAQDKTMDALRSATDDAVKILIGSKQVFGPGERAYLEAVLKRWQMFAAECGDSVQTRNMRAEGVFKVACLQSVFGQYKEAEAGYLESIALREKLATEFPFVPAHRHQLGMSHLNLGLVFDRLGKQTEALRHTEQAWELCAKLVAEFPNVRDYRAELASCHLNLGNLLNDRGKRVEAQAHHEQALAITAKLVVEFPTVPEYRHTLGGSHNSMGVLLVDLMKYTEAQMHFEQALALHAKLATEFPSEPEYQVYLANHHHNLGNLLFEKLGNYTEAQPHYEQALKLRAKLAGAFPAVPEYRRVLAQHHLGLGTLLKKLKSHTEAQTHYEQAMAIREKLVAEFPAVPKYRRDLTRDYNFLGTVLSKLGEQVKAQTHYQQAVSIGEKLVVEFPDVTEYRHDLARAYHCLGNVVSDLGKKAEAQTHYQQAVSIEEKLVADFPDVTGYRHDLARNYYCLGNVVSDLGKKAEAQTYYQRAVSIEEKLVAEFPDMTEYKTSLGASYYNIGILLEYVCKVI